MESTDLLTYCFLMHISKNFFLIEGNLIPYCREQELQIFFSAMTKESNMTHRAKL